MTEQLAEVERTSMPLDGELIAPSAAPAGARAIVLPDFGPSDRRVDYIAPLGDSVLDMVRGTLPTLPPPMYERLRVTIGEHVIPLELWDKVRPKPHAVVLIRALPGATDYFRAALFLAVTVAATVTGQYYLGPMAASALALEAGSLGAQFVTSAVTAAAPAGGSLLVYNPSPRN